MTLIEMLLVLTIIGIISAVVFPSVTSGLDNLRLRTTADRLASTFRYARERAVRQQTVCQVTVDPARRVVEFEDVGAAAARASGGSARRSWALPEDISVHPERARAFLFSPDGGVPRMDFRLRNGRGRTASIQFDVLSALPEVHIQ